MTLSTRVLNLNAKALMKGTTKDCRCEQQTSEQRRFDVSWVVLLGSERLSD